MHFSIWLAFLSVALLTCFSPGPAVLLAVSNAMAGGVQRAVWSSLGNALGICLVSSVATAGLGAVLSTSGILFLWLKLVGAAYLVYLGFRQWSKADGASFVRNDLSGTDVSTDGRAELLRRGFLVAATNPKSILFFTALYPQFLNRHAPSGVQFFALTGTYVLCALLSHAVFMFLALRARGLIHSRHAARRLTQGSGIAFVVMGLALLGLRKQA